VWMACRSVTPGHVAAIEHQMIPVLRFSAGAAALPTIPEPPRYCLRRLRHVPRGAWPLP
jgi:hypothetical protein